MRRPKEQYPTMIKRMDVSGKLFPLVCCLLIAGCGRASLRPVIDTVAHAKKMPDGTYEVQLGYSMMTE